MSSAIGDMVNNPVIKQNQTSLLARGLQGFNRGVADLPDMLSNVLSRAGGYLRPQDGHHEPLWKIDPVEHAFESLGIINPDMPPAQSYGERSLEKGAEMAGGMAIPIGGAVKGLGEGAGSVTSLLAKALLGNNTSRTIGSIVAPAAASPAIEDYTQNPVARAGLEFGTSVLGSGAGGSLSRLGKTLMGKPSVTLPEFTAAQQSYMDAPDAGRTKDLIARQLDLAKKDPKSADILDQIGKKQEEKIITGMTPENPIAPDEITRKIKDYTQGLIEERGNDYQTAKSSMLSNPRPVDPSSTINLINKFKSEAANGTPLMNALTQAEKIILDNTSDPNKVMNAKTAIQNMANYSQDLHLDGQESAIMKQIAGEFGKNIDTAMPGYGAMNKTYADQTKNLQGIIKGIGGKTVATGETSPSSLPRKMFEKIDPELSPQLQEILPADTYKQAAQSYLGDVLKRAQTTPSKNTYNNQSQMYKMGDILEKNYPTLQSTLPAEELAKVDQAMRGIDVTMMGRPRNDYTIQARRNLSVGDEVKGMGSSVSSLNPYNPLTWPTILAKKSITTPLQRNEMLTGVSPMGQIGGGIANQAIRGEGVSAMNPTPLNPTQPNIPQQPFEPIQNMPLTQKQNPGQGMTSPSPNSTSAIDQVMQQYGLGKNLAQNTQNNVNQNNKKSAVEQVMQEYGLTGGTQQQKSQLQENSSQHGVPLTQDSLDFLYKRLKSGDNSVLDDFDKSYGEYQSQPFFQKDDFRNKVKDIIASKESKGSGDYQAQAPNSSAAGRYQFLDATRDKMVPGVSRDVFINNPDIQEYAMDKLMDSNMNDFNNAGIDINNVQPQNLAGMLMAAHLRGSRAGINAYQDPNYQGIPDPNGTLPRSYYDYAASSY